MRLSFVTFVLVLFGVSAYADVGLYVSLGGGGEISRCVPAGTETLSLADVLGRAGLTYEASGAALLAVDGVSAGGGRAWYVSRLRGDDATEPSTSTGVTFESGDVALVQLAATPESRPPVNYAQVCEVKHRAAIFVVHSSGTMTSRCVTFPGGSTTAGRLLDLSGVPRQTFQFSFGRGFCAIDGEGCPATADDCFFCDAQGRYWGVYMRGVDGTPVASNFGADQTTVYPGDVVIFYYGEFGQSPPQLNLADACGDEVQLEANLHALDAWRCVVSAVARSPYALGDATAAGRLSIILPPGLELVPESDPAARETVDGRGLSALWIVGAVSPEAAAHYRMRVQMDGAPGLAYRDFGWRSGDGKLADLNHDGRVDKDDLLLLRQEWEP